MGAAIHNATTIFLHPHKSLQRNGMECVYFLQTIFARHPKQGSTGKESRERVREAIEAI
jgi:hypothetical protein